jgi:hypothetical protein
MKWGSLVIYIRIGTVVIEIYLLALDGLHEALGFAVVVGITAATHLTDQAVFCK